MEINPDNLESRQRYKLMVGGVVPRPIAFVSTCDENGVRNLAPFSFYNAVCFNPIILAFFPVRYKQDRELKDTARNIKQTGEFVINASTESLAGQINTSSGRYKAGVDEFEITGLTAIPSEKITPPGVKESPIQFECRLEQMVALGEDQGGADAVFGRVVHIRIADEMIQDFRIDENKLRPLARLAGSSYSTLGNVFDLERPVIK